jgi:hypothetical protein|eukprot:1178766-Prymnesium_polylepis.2
MGFKILREAEHADQLREEVRSSRKVALEGTYCSRQYFFINGSTPNIIFSWRTRLPTRNFAEFAQERRFSQQIPAAAKRNKQNN